VPPKRFVTLLKDSSDDIHVSSCWTRV